MRTIFHVILLCCYCGIGAAASFEDELVQAAIDRTKHNVKYDGAYYSIDYPGGDVPANIGVCTDVLIRYYREIEVDLQKEVNEDIVTNIDHRRVPNLQVFFKRNGQELPITDNASDYKAGEIVTWMLPGNSPHIGIVTDRMSADNKRPLIAHNIGSGPRLEDMLFDFKITGHYKYAPEKHE